MGEGVRSTGSGAGGAGERAMTGGRRKNDRRAGPPGPRTIAPGAATVAADAEPRRGKEKRDADEHQRCPYDLGSATVEHQSGQGPQTDKRQSHRRGGSDRPSGRRQDSSSFPARASPGRSYSARAARGAMVLRAGTRHRRMQAASHPGPLSCSLSLSLRRLDGIGDTAARNATPP